MILSSVSLAMRLLSAIPAVVSDREEFVTELRYLPQGWAAVIAIGGAVLIVAIVVWMYRHEGRAGSSPRLRTFLAVVRCVVLLMLGIIALEPVRVRILRKWIDSYAVILVDDSSSMDLVDGYRDEAARARVAKLSDGNAGAIATGGGTGSLLRRCELIEPVLAGDDRKFLRDLSRNNRVQMYTFSDEPALRSTLRAAWDPPPIASDPGSRPTDTASATGPIDGESGPRSTGVGSPPALVEADGAPVRFVSKGSATNVERGVRGAVEALGSAPIAAVIVLSDGGFNQGTSAEQVGRFARERKIPIHVVGVGDPSPPRNIRVTELQAPERVFQNDPFVLSVRLTAEGIDGETLPVDLRERDASRGDEGKILESKTATVGSGGAIQPVTFERRPDHVGRFIYTVEAPIVDGEVVVEDNVRQTTVQVIDAKTRVLLVSGEPSWDYHFVSTLLQRDDTLDVSCWLQSAEVSAVRDGDVVIDPLPVSPEELLEYGVVILMDPDSEEFDAAWYALLDKFVTEFGGGLMYVASRAHTPAFLRTPDARLLVDLLPVSLDPEADLVLNQIGHYQLSPSPLDIPPSAFTHPAMKMDEDATASKLIWQGIGDIHWHYPVLREKPAATVLMRHGNPRMRNTNGGHVLAATQFVGAGRTGFLAFDGTYRWRRHGVPFFDHFWIQWIRYLAEGRLLGGNQRGTLLTDSDNFSLGQAVNVSARLLDVRFEPLIRPEVKAAYTLDGERTNFVLSPRADGAGWYEGRFIPDRVGSYRITVALPVGAPGEQAELSKEIRVSTPNLEILRPQMDRAALMTLAAESHGGRYFEIDEAAGLPALVPDMHEEIQVRSRPTALWDRWITLVAFLVLLGVEWGVRKWHQML